MSRIAVAISCEAEVMNELIRMSKGRSEEARMVERSRIILGCLAGKRNDMVAAELGVRLGTVGTWRKRFAEVSLAGLSDRPRPGKPPTYPADLKQRILQRLEKSAPPGLASWDGGKLAQALGISDDAVWRVLRKEGIQLRRYRWWCVSTDPQFAAKAAESLICT